MSKTKSFRVAVEGATVDGRTIERNWLLEMAASYNRETYAARVNLEHIRGITAGKPFKAYGDVLSLRTQEIDLQLGGTTQKKLALFAEIEATEELVAMNRDKQKLYTSIEVNPSFADTKKAYLVGLAVTDSPASLGTEMLTFAVKHPGISQHIPATQATDNVFSLGQETSFELADGEAPTGAAGMFAAATEFFKNFGKPTEPPVEKPKDETPPTPANDNDKRFAALVAGIGKMTTGMEAFRQEVTTQLGAVKGEIAIVKASIDTTDGNGAHRPPATGGNGALVTDC